MSVKPVKMVYTVHLMPIEYWLYCVRCTVYTHAYRALTILCEVSCPTCSTIAFHQPLLLISLLPRQHPPALGRPTWICIWLQDPFPWPITFSPARWPADHDSGAYAQLSLPSVHHQEFAFQPCLNFVWFSTWTFETVWCLLLACAIPCAVLDGARVRGPVYYVFTSNKQQTLPSNGRCDSKQRRRSKEFVQI